MKPPQKRGEMLALAAPMQMPASLPARPAENPEAMVPDASGARADARGDTDSDNDSDNDSDSDSNDDSCASDADGSAAPDVEKEVGAGAAEGAAAPSAEEKSDADENDYKELFEGTEMGIRTLQATVETLTRANEGLASRLSLALNVTRPG